MTANDTRVTRYQGATKGTNSGRPFPTAIISHDSRTEKSREAVEPGRRGCQRLLPVGDPHSLWGVEVPALYRRQDFDVLS